MRFWVARDRRRGEVVCRFFLREAALTLLGFSSSDNMSFSMVYLKFWVYLFITILVCSKFRSRVVFRVFFFLRGLVLYVRSYKSITWGRKVKVCRMLEVRFC